MSYGESINIIGDFFKLTFVENPGIAFGIDVDGVSKLLLSLFTLLASIGVFYYLWKSKEQKLIIRLALALILGGAIGNLIDRTFYGLLYDYSPLFYGKVVDFFDVDFFDFTLFGRSYDRWPVFNIADAAVTIGVLILLLFYKKHQNEDEKVEAVDSSAITESLSVSEVNEPVQNGNGSDIIKNDLINEQTDNRKEISD